MDMHRREMLSQFFESTLQIKRQLCGARAEYLRAHDVTEPQVELLYLASHGELAIKDVAALLNVTSSAATQQVEVLVRKGYLQREAQEGDRRGVRVMLSQAGKEKFAVLKEAHIDALSNRLSGLTDEELALMVRIKTKMAESYRQLPTYP